MLQKELNDLYDTIGIKKSETKSFEDNINQLQKDLEYWQQSQTQIGESWKKLSDQDNQYERQLKT